MRRFDSSFFLQFTLRRFERWYCNLSAAFGNLPGVGLQRIPVLTDEPGESFLVDGNDSNGEILEMNGAINSLWIERE